MDMNDVDDKLYILKRPNLALQSAGEATQGAYLVQSTERSKRWKNLRFQYIVHPCHIFRLPYLTVFCLQILKGFR